MSWSVFIDCHMQRIMIGVIGYAFAGIGIKMGIDHIDKEYNKQTNADDLSYKRIDLADKVIKDRG